MSQKAARELVIRWSTNMVSVYEWLRQVNEQVWDSRQWPNRTPEDKEVPQYHKSQIQQEKLDTCQAVIAHFNIFLCWFFH